MPFIETADRTSLFVTDWGSGPPVVFTHAWGLRSDQWTYQIPALAGAGLRCVLYDRRGHGRSDRPATGYDIDTLADDLAAVIGHFGLHEATLVAHSLGSKEAIRYLTRHGDARINRLVLIAPVTPLLRRTADNPTAWTPPSSTPTTPRPRPMSRNGAPTSRRPGPTSGPALAVRRA